MTAHSLTALSLGKGSSQQAAEDALVGKPLQSCSFGCFEQLCIAHHHWEWWNWLSGNSLTQPTPFLWSKYRNLLLEAHADIRLSVGCQTGQLGPDLVANSMCCEKCLKDLGAFGIFIQRNEEMICSQNVLQQTIPIKMKF